MQSRLSRFAARAKRAFKAVGRAAAMAGRIMGGALKAGLIGLAAGATAAFFAITKLTGEMDELAKTTRALDFPIEEFQEWRFAAEQSGVGQEVFNKSLKKFSKGVGEAKAGTGAMVTILKKANPELLKQLKSTDNVADAFDLYIKAIRETPGAMNKAALSSAAFGRAGVDMINLANASQEEIEKLREQMRENGLVTQEQAAAAEEFNDMMNRLKLTIVSVFRDVVVPLLPDLTRFADTIRKWAVQNRAIIKAKVAEWAKKVAQAAKNLYKWFKKAWPEIKKTGKAIVDFAGDVLEFVGTLWEFKEVLIALALGFGAVKVPMMGLKLAECAGTLTTMG
jgi:hypothetical protein